MTVIYDDEQLDLQASPPDLRRQTAKLPKVWTEDHRGGQVIVTVSPPSEYVQLSNEQMALLHEIAAGILRKNMTARMLGDFVSVMGTDVTKTAVDSILREMGLEIA